MQPVKNLKLLKLEIHYTNTMNFKPSHKYINDHKNAHSTETALIKSHVNMMDFQQYLLMNTKIHVKIKNEIYPLHL